MDREWRAGSDGQGMGGQAQMGRSGGLGHRQWCSCYLHVLQLGFSELPRGIPSHSQDIWLKDENKCYTRQGISRLTGFSFSFPSLLFC